MSYSLYLWHWPVLLYARFYFGEHLSLPQLLFCWSIIGLLSYGSWRWIESALRGHHWWAGRWKAYLGAAAISVPLSAGAAMVMLKDGYDQRLPDKALSLLNIERWPDFGLCATEYKHDQFDDCVIGTGDNPASVLVWGDSHAQTLIWAINHIAEGRNSKVRHVTKGGCPPIYEGVRVSANIDKEACLNAQKTAWRIVESDSALTTVLIAARWRLYDSATLSSVEGKAGEDFDDRLYETVQRLLKRDLKVVVVDSLPEVGFDVANVLAREVLLGKKFTLNFDYESQPTKHLSAISDIQDENFSILNLDSLLCGRGKCPLFEGSHLLYFDDNHLARAAATKLIPEIERALFPSSLK